MPRQLVASLTLVAAAAVLVLPARPARGRLAELSRPPGSGPAGASTWRPAPGPRAGPAPTRTFLGRRTVGLPMVLPTAWGPPLLAGSVAGVAWLAAGPVAALAAATYAVLVVRALSARARRRAESHARTAAVDLVAGLAADLRAGLVGSQALCAALDTLLQLPAAGRDHGGLRAVQAAARHGGDVPSALRAVRDDVLAPLVLRRLAAAWAVADSGGAPLASVLDRLEADVAARRRAEQRATAETAAARSTSRLLAGLPLVGLALGHALGADPVAVLLHTPVGAVCTVVALVLQLAGLTWTARLSRPAAT